MAWIILVAVAVAVAVVTALAWWGSGRAKPVTSHTTQTEKATMPTPPYNLG